MEVKPQRKIPIGRRAVTGTMAVKHGLVRYESSLERDMLVTLDADVTITEVVEQPFSIPYIGLRGRRTSYVPDYFAERRDGRSLVIEVKYREELQRRWDELRPRFRAATAFAAVNGMRFRIFDDVRLRTPLLANLKFLRRYQTASIDRDPIEETLVWILKHRSPISASTLISEAYASEPNRIQAIPKLWGLVRSGRIVANLSVPLTMGTLLEVRSGQETAWPGPHSYDHPLAEAHLRRQGIFPNRQVFNVLPEGEATDIAFEAARRRIGGPS